MQLYPIVKSDSVNITIEDMHLYQKVFYERCAMHYDSSKYIQMMKKTGITVHEYIARQVWYSQKIAIEHVNPSLTELDELANNPNHDNYAHNLQVFKSVYRIMRTKMSLHLRKLYKKLLTDDEYDQLDLEFTELVRGMDVYELHREIVGTKQALDAASKYKQVQEQHIFTEKQANELVRAIQKKSKISDSISIPPMDDNTDKESDGFKVELDPNHTPFLQKLQKLQKLHPSEGVKYDTGKPRMELLPPDALKAVAEILTYGANKYTTFEHVELEELICHTIQAVTADQPNVNTTIKLTIPWAIARNVITEKLEKDTTKTLSIRELRQNGLGNTDLLAMLTNTDYPQNVQLSFSNKSNEINVAAVEKYLKGVPETDAVSITITEQGKPGDSFVVTVTEESDLSATLYELFAKRWPTLKTLLPRHTLQAQQGARNWEKGMQWSRVYGALQRHVNAFWDGEDYDDESGLPHIAHAACCSLFLLSYFKRAMFDFDDRPEL